MTDATITRGELALKEVATRRWPKCGYERKRSILHSHVFGVHRLLPGDAFQPCEDTPVLILVALHGEATLLFAVRPGQPDEVLFGLGERHERTDAEGKDADSDGSTHPSVNVLPVADLSDCRGGNHGVADSYLFLTDDKVHRRASFGARQRPSIVDHFVSAI